MAGELVPLVLIPRYTTYSGAHTFTTIAMDVTDYQSAIVNVWRGALNGGGTYAISFEESTSRSLKFLRIGSRIWKCDCSIPVAAWRHSRATPRCS